MYIAVRDGKQPEMLGFACYDATVKGFFGPTGVSESCRGMGIGNALLQACLHGMRDYGYGYAIVPAAPRAYEFYKKCLPESSSVLEGAGPGVYRSMLTLQNT